jgi:hypothetical protein
VVSVAWLRSQQGHRLSWPCDFPPRKMLGRYRTK